MGEKVKYTKLYAPDGTLVEVEGEERAEILKDRGYTTSKPKNPTQPQGNSAQAEIDRLTAENEKLRAEAEAAKQSGDTNK